MEPELQYMLPIQYLIDEGLATLTEVEDRMSVMDVERMIHIHVARKSQRERARRTHANERS